MSQNITPDGLPTEADIQRFMVHYATLAGGGKANCTHIQAGLMIGPHDDTVDPVEYRIYNHRLERSFAAKTIWECVEKVQDALRRPAVTEALTKARAEVARLEALAMEGRAV